jgi:small subunit ribosomal protein S17
MKMNDAKQTGQLKVNVRGRPLSLRGNVFTGVVVSDKMQKTVTVEWERRTFIPKYERYEMRRTKVKAHNPPEMSAKEGDMVKIKGCRAISKSKHFVIVENMGHVFGYEEKSEALEESKVKEKPKKVQEADVKDSKPEESPKQELKSEKSK